MKKILALVTFAAVLAVFACAQNADTPPAAPLIQVNVTTNVVASVAPLVLSASQMDAIIALIQTNGIMATVPITSANLGGLTLVRRDDGAGNISFVVDTSGNGLYAGVNLTNGSVIIPGALTVSGAAKFSNNLTGGVNFTIQSGSPGDSIYLRDGTGNNIIYGGTGSGVINIGAATTLPTQISGNGFLIKSNTAAAPVAGYTYFWNSNNAAMFSIRVGVTNFLFNL